MLRSARVFALIAAALTMTIGALLAQVSATIKPGLFKMQPVAGGGAIPLTGPVMRVPYDHTQRRYLAIDEEPLELRLTLSVDCGANKFGGMSLEVAGTTLTVDTAGLAKTGSGYSGSKTLTTNAVTTRALDNASVPNPVALCTDDFAALVKSGAYGKAQKGWARQFDNALPATLSLRCSAPNTKKGAFEQPGALYVEKATTRFPVWVHCGPAAVFRPDDSKPDVPAKRSSDIDPKSEPQRVPGPPQRTGGAPQRVAGSPGPEALPDLIVAAAQPAPTAPSKLRVQIANKGTAASPPTKLTLFYHRSGRVMKVQADVPPLHAGETRWIIVDTGSPLSYASQITLRVDDPPGVSELDEANNAFTVK